MQSVEIGNLVFDGASILNPLHHLQRIGFGLRQAHRLRSLVAIAPLTQPKTVSETQTVGDYPITYDSDGYPVLPACLDRRTKP